jgi:hypothetical protein
MSTLSDSMRGVLNGRYYATLATLNKVLFDGTFQPLFAR